MRIARWTALLAILACSTAAASPFDRLIVFGDSNSDTGNVAAAALAANAPPFLAGGQYDQAFYYQGRFTNGPNYVDVLAERLGLSSAPAIAGGTNFALGGASTGFGESIVDPSFPDFKVPGIGLQIGQFLLGSPAITGRDLFVVYGGANDFLNTPGGPPSAESVAENVIAHLNQLVGAGATHILVPNLPPLGQLPITRGLTPPGPTLLDLLTMQYNGLLAARLASFRMANPGVSIYELKVDQLIAAALADPGAFGLTNVTDRAFIYETGTVVADPDGYLFWDNVHPSARGYELLGAAAFAAVVPEPTSLATTAIGLAGLIGYGRLRRRRSA